jgi:hypothetical protein
MSRYEARETPTRQPEAQRSQASAASGRPWTEALRRDAREFGHTAEYEFRKVVGASRSLVQHKSAPEPTSQKGSRAGRFERKPIARKPEPERPQPERPQQEPAREAKPTEQAIPKLE